MKAVSKNVVWDQLFIVLHNTVSASTLTV